MNFSDAFASAPIAQITASLNGVSILGETDDPSTATAFRWLVGRRIWQLREVVVVRPVIDIEFRFKSLTAGRAILPGAGMALGVVKTAQGVSTVVPGATVACVREQDVVGFVIANPLAAAFGPDEVASLPTETAATFCGNFGVLGFSCRLLSRHDALLSPCAR